MTTHCSTSTFGRFGSPIVMAALLMALASCKHEKPPFLQGYVEGEYVYVSAPSAGKIEALLVQRGQQVETGALLFELEKTAEKAAHDEADQRLRQSLAALEDAKKGKRPPEIESLQAQIKQAEEALALSGRELKRQENLTLSGAVAIESIDRARSGEIQNRHRVEQLKAELKTAELGSRSDLIAAAGSDVKAREAALARTEWDLSQKQQRAPQAGLVNDTLYRVGEWAAAGRPVVSLLPPANVKVRVFVPQTRLGLIHVGDTVKVMVDGASAALSGRVNFISPQAEYTPPVIYSQENRSKLVFMIELRFDDATAATLHPGQPVDVDFNFPPDHEQHR